MLRDSMTQIGALAEQVSEFTCARVNKLVNRMYAYVSRFCAHGLKVSPCIHCVGHAHSNGTSASNPAGAADAAGCPTSRNCHSRGRRGITKELPELTQSAQAGIMTCLSLHDAVQLIPHYIVLNAWYHCKILRSAVVALVFSPPPQQLYWRYVPSAQLTVWALWAHVYCGHKIAFPDNFSTFYPWVRWNYQKKHT